MICNRTQTGWQIIYQRAHALLAAKLIAPWRAEERPERWMETLSATAQHDNGWQDWETGRRLTPARTPRHFRETPIDNLVTQSRRALTRAWHQGLWSGLLVSRHVSFLYEPLRGEDDAMDALLDEQQAQREAWRDQLAVDEEAVSRAYALLRWGDTFSLVLCQQQMPFNQRSLEIDIGPEGTRYHAREVEDGIIEVDPWPYAVEEVVVSVDSYVIEQLTFDSEDALAEALREAALQSCTWCLRPAA